MKILIIEPGKHPYEKNIEHTLENLQSIVGGHIEAVYPFEDKVALVCNEEALFLPLKVKPLFGTHQIHSHPGSHQAVQGPLGQCSWSHVSR